MKLNLPECELRLGRDVLTGAVTVYDRLRRKYVTVTPEEWVRQHFVAFLIAERGFPAGRMANEVSMRLNGTLKRSDTVVYDDRRRPIVIVEYKAPDVQLTQQVFDQIVRYNSVLRAHWLIVSNGLSHYCLEVDYEHNRCRYLEDIPTWQAITAASRDSATTASC